MKKVILFIIAWVLLLPTIVYAETNKINKYTYLENDMSFHWKKKKGKYALVLNQEGQDIVLTDYIYSVSKTTAKSNIYIYKDSFGKKCLSNYYVTVEREGKFGILDLSGNEVIPCIYSTMYNSSGNVIHGSKYKYTSYENVGSRALYILMYFVTDENNKWGYIYDSHNIIEPIFDNIYIKETRLHLNVPQTSLLCNDFFRDMMTVGFWNIPLRDNNSDYARFSPIVEKDGKYGLIDGGEIKIPPMFDKESFYFNSNEIVQDDSGYIRIRDSFVSQNSIKGGIGKFQTISIQEKLYLLLMDGEKVWYDTRNGNIIKIGDVKSELIYKTNKNIYYQYYNDTGYGYVTDDGYEIPPIYGEEIDNFFIIPTDTAQIFIVKNSLNDKLVGLYNAKLKKEILAPEYSKIVKTNLKDGFFLLEKDSTSSFYAYLSHKGDSVIILNDKINAYNNAQLTPINNTLSLVKKDNAYGMTDSESGLIIPCIYDSIKPLEVVVKNISDNYKGIWVTFLNNNVGLLTKDAVVLYPYYSHHSLRFKNNKLELISNSTRASEKVSIAALDDEFKIEYNWDELLNKILTESYYYSDWNEYTDVAYLAHYTDNFNLLKSATFAHIKRFEDDLWSLATDGSDFEKRFNQLVGLCFYSYMQLGMDELEEYINNLKVMSANLSAMKQARIKKQQEEEAERQRIYEEHQRQARIAAQQARLERERQWENLAFALINVIDKCNTAINPYLSKKHKNNHSHNSTGAHSHTSSSSSNNSGYVTCNHCSGTGSCGFTKDWNLNKRSCHGTGKCSECQDGIIHDTFGSRLCTYCNGTGQCPICNGTGKCTQCHGTGKMKK